jgi:hypothetical protein
VAAARQRQNDPIDYYYMSCLLSFFSNAQRLSDYWSLDRSLSKSVLMVHSLIQEGRNVLWLPCPRLLAFAWTIVENFGKICPRIARSSQ